MPKEFRCVTAIYSVETYTGFCSPTNDKRFFQEKLFPICVEFPNRFVKITYSNNFITVIEHMFLMCLEHPEGFEPPLIQLRCYGVEIRSDTGALLT